jgi:hypothetical protein
VNHVKINVEIEEFEALGRISHAVADYVRAMLKVHSLRRAVGEALLEAEHCKKKLSAHLLVEAQRLLEGVEPKPPPNPRLLRRVTRRLPRTDSGEADSA